MRCLCGPENKGRYEFIGPEVKTRWPADLTQNPDPARALESSIDGDQFVVTVQTPGVFEGDILTGNLSSLNETFTNAGGCTTMSTTVEIDGVIYAPIVIDYSAETTPEPEADPVTDDTDGNDADQAEATDTGISQSDDLQQPDSEAGALTPLNETETKQVYGIVVHADIAGNVKALIEAADADGITLTGSGYRFDASRISSSGTHERGLAIDFLQADNKPIVESGPEHNWLQTNAAPFGLLSKVGAPLRTLSPAANEL